MSDRTSARIFGELLTYADEHEDLELLQHLIRMYDRGDYDFAWDDAHAKYDRIFGSRGIGKVVWSKTFKEWCFEVNRRNGRAWAPNWREWDPPE